MTDWFESMAGPAYAPALMWTALALLALLVVIVAVKIFRSLSAGTFIAGGRNRKARLAVLDATAIDGQRRLVLVRRDDVEHLILIGGSNDLVVERDIRDFAEEPRGEIAPSLPVSHHQGPGPKGQPAIDPSPETESRPVSPSAQEPQAASSRPAVPSRSPASDTPPVSAPQPAAAPPVGAAPRTTPSPAPVQREPQLDQPSEGPYRQTPPQSHRATSPAPASAAAPEPAKADTSVSDGARSPITAAPAASVANASKAHEDADLDDALLQELELTLEDDDRRSTVAAEKTTQRDPRMDEEMDRLLGELSGERR